MQLNRLLIVQTTTTSTLWEPREHWLSDRSKTWNRPLLDDHGILSWVANPRAAVMFARDGAAKEDVAADPFEDIVKDFKHVDARTRIYVAAHDLVHRDTQKLQLAGWRVERFHHGDGSLFRAIRAFVTQPDSQSFDEVLRAFGLDEELLALSLLLQSYLVCHQAQWTDDARRICAAIGLTQVIDDERLVSGRARTESREWWNEALALSERRSALNEQVRACGREDVMQLLDSILTMASERGSLDIDAVAALLRGIISVQPRTAMGI